MFQSDSCGTANYHIGLPPDRRTIANTLRNGVPISHAARQLKEEDLDEYDLVVAMDQSNYDNIQLLSTAIINQHKIKLMREYDPIEPGDVPDPYYGGDTDFQYVYEILDRSIEKLIINFASDKI